MVHFLSATVVCFAAALDTNLVNAAPSFCQLLPISLRINVMPSFQAEVIANNGNGLSVGILVTVNFTDMNDSPMVNLPPEPYRGEVKNPGSGGEQPGGDQTWVRPSPPLTPRATS